MAMLFGSGRISIRMTVVSAFAIATLLTAVLAIGLQYYFGHALARDAARDLYAKTAAGAAEQLMGVGAQTRKIMEMLVEYPLLATGAPGPAQHQLFATVLKQNPLFYAIYLGRENGSFYELINLHSSEVARRKLGAIPEDRWVLLSTQGTEGDRQRRYDYLNEDFIRRERRLEPTDFEVNTRPWYISAADSNETQTTGIYEFSQLQASGQTISKRIPGTDTVVGIDITLAGISQYLSNQVAGGEAVSVVFKKAGEVVATSLQPGPGNGLQESAVASENNISKLITGGALVEIAKVEARHGRMIELVQDGKSYFAYVTRLAGSDESANYFGILEPSEAVMGTFMDKVMLSIAITSGFLLMVLPLSWIFATPVVRPIRQLAAENDKIRRRDYNKVERVSAWVKELDELSESMVVMVEAIATHEQQQRMLMDSFIQLIAQAIDDKSPYTGGHCARVPELAFMLAEQASISSAPAFTGFRLETDEQWREYKIAAWLHDCGKITTPEHIVDKGSKLETIYNRIHEVRMRFEVLWRDAEIQYWRKSREQPDREKELADWLASQRHTLREEFGFVAQCNVGGEFLDEGRQARLIELSRKTWQRNFDDRLGLSPVEELRVGAESYDLPATEYLLSDKPEHIIERTQSTDYAPELGIKMEVPDHLYNLGEVYNLSISRGTLTAEDRFKINEHMISTIKMLEGLPFPEELRNVPRYASTHHETMKGSGYPRRLPGKALSIPERILAVADVFEALTASDRPYKKAKPVSVAVDILHKMVLDNHIDRDCFELFIRSKIYSRYAQQYLAPEQNDTVDEAKYLV